jgi:hypothetical protein
MAAVEQNIVYKREVQAGDLVTIRSTVRTASANSSPAKTSPAKTSPAKTTMMPALARQ